ncbi:MAG: hypothetical protein U5J95_04800 [Balneolaceae bacterium]|nr:hypothetical protein [Balneolaceae bacterium]
MLNDENACIRYLMKEMDPSEEVLMERAMMEDDDLLIEVECLRQTFQRLDNLPDKEPPAHLTESIISQAAEYKENQRSYLSLVPENSFKYAVAASVVIALTLGGFWVMDNGNATVNEDQNRSASVASDASQFPIISNSFEVTPVKAGEAKPWIDRNDVIRFEDQYNQANAEFDTILNNSMQKLTPITEPFTGSAGSRSLQMTGAGSNN